MSKDTSKLDDGEAESVSITSDSAKRFYANHPGYTHEDLCRAIYGGSVALVVPHGPDEPRAESVHLYPITVDGKPVFEHLVGSSDGDKKEDK